MKKTFFLKAGFFSFRKTIFAKLLLAFLITIVPIYISGVMIYSWGVNTLQQEIINRNLSQQQYYFEGLRKEVDQIKTLQSRYLTGREISWLVNTYATTSAYERGYYALRIQDNMVSLKNSSNFLEDVAVYMPQIGKRILASSGYDDLEPRDLDTLDAISIRSDSGLGSDGDHLYITLSYPPFSALTDKKAFYTICAVFSLQEFRKSLQQFNTYPGSGSVLFAEGLPVIASDDTGIAEEVMARIAAKDRSETDGQSFSAVIEGKRYLITYDTSSYMGYTLGSYTLETEIFRQVRTNQYIVWTLSIIAAILTAIFVFLAYTTIQSPMRLLVQAFKRVDGGEMGFSLPVNRQDEFGYMYAHFNDMLMSINRLIKDTYEQKLMLKYAELDQLQAQINPHFIYNSYYLLHRMIKSDDKENAVYFSRQMGTYFKFITRSQGNNVELSQEVEHARIYAQIQCMRFSNRISIRFDPLPSEFDNVLVPRLIVQPLLENAFEYALSDKLADGLLSVSFESTERSVIIRVEDNGEELTDEKIMELQKNLQTGDVHQSENIGLLNIHRRLQAAFPGEGRLDIGRSSLGGMEVLLHIPTKAETRQNHV